MVTENDSRVIDPNLPSTADRIRLGAFFGNLLLNWYSQPGHSNANDDRVAYQEWILRQSEDLLGDVPRCFLELWNRSKG